MKAASFFFFIHSFFDRHLDSLHILSMADNVQ